MVSHGFFSKLMRLFNICLFNMMALQLQIMDGILCLVPKDGKFWRQW